MAVRHKKTKAVTYFADMKLKNKLSLIIALVALIITSLATISFQAMVRQYDELLYTQTANSLSYISKDISNELNAIDSISQYVSTHKTFQAALDTLNTTESYSFESLLAINDIREVLNQYFTTRMVCMAAYAQNDKTIWWGSDSSEEDPAVIQALFEACDENPGRAVWASTGRDDSSVLCARQVRKVESLKLENMGYLVIRVDLDRLARSTLRTSYAGQHQPELVIYTEGGILYPQGSTTSLSTPTATGGYDILDIEGERYFATYTALTGGGSWYAAFAIPYNDVFQTLTLRNLMFFLCLLFSVAVSILVSSALIKSISYQFNTLVDKMDRLKVADFEVQRSRAPARKDELGQLNDYFDQMTLELKKRIDESYVKELLITQAEFKALEQQIDPHFLYNTLNTVNWLARRAGSEDICTIVEALGSLLRTTLGQTQDVIPIGDELSVLRNYILIQNIRFQDTLTVTLEADEDCLHIPIPKMSIQPLVENAIRHSQDEVREAYTVAVTVKRYAETIRIRVLDNGPGIDPGILDKLRSNSVEPRGTGVGLLNIDSRLRIIFGEPYGLFFGREGENTVVGFDVPVAPKKRTAREDG